MIRDTVNTFTVKVIIRASRHQIMCSVEQLEMGLLVSQAFCLQVIFLYLISPGLIVISKQTPQTQPPQGEILHFKQ